MSSKRKSNGGSSATALKAPPRPATNPGIRPGSSTAAAQQTTAPAAQGSTPPQVSEVKSKPRHEDIARAAYLRWLREGGDPATNWLAAEAELTGRAALKL